jgi:hypothetical protein
MTQGRMARIPAAFSLKNRQIRTILPGGFFPGHFFAAIQVEKPCFML